jgi:uncharacterized Fe-S center protein
MKSKVYFLTWDKIDELIPFLKKAGAFNHVKTRQNLAIKMHFGEDGNKGYVKPEYVKQIVKVAKDEKSAFPFLTDTTTLYAGKRADAYHHLICANKHGFNIDNCGCPVIIADGLRGDAQIAVDVNLKHFAKVFVARDIFLADDFIFINHFKGHEMTGFGGALKNIGMGCASKAGKFALHSFSHPSIKSDKCLCCGNCVKKCLQKAITLIDKKPVIDDKKCSGCGQCLVICPRKVFYLTHNGDSQILQEKIVEYAAGVLKDKKSFNINFLNHITKYCDCFSGIKNNPVMDDIGVAASADPAAVDQASYDLINKAYGKEVFTKVYWKIDPTIQLKYAQSAGIGNCDYELIKY